MSLKVYDPEQGVSEGQEIGLDACRIYPGWYTPREA